MQRGRLNETEIRALTKRRRAVKVTVDRQAGVATLEKMPLSSTERAALSRMGTFLPKPKDVVRLAVEEASAIEWRSSQIARPVELHEAAVRKHLAAMGPRRARAIVGQLSLVDWHARDPGRRIRSRSIGHDELEALRRRIARTRAKARRRRALDVDRELRRALRDD
jgi:hypothetical protein